MKDMKRALRRHHRQRLIKKVTNYQIAYWHTKTTLEKRKAIAIRHYDTIKSCSCFMCGNPRKIEGQTLQEKKFKEGQ